MHACIHTYIGTYIPAYIHTDRQTYRQTYIHNITLHYITLHNITYRQTYIQTDIHAYIHTCIHLYCLYIYIYLFMYIVNIYIYSIYLHSLWRQTKALKANSGKTKAAAIAACYCHKALRQHRFWIKVKGKVTEVTTMQMRPDDPDKTNVLNRDETLFSDHCHQICSSQSVYPGVHWTWRPYSTLPASWCVQQCAWTINEPFAGESNPVKHCSLTGIEAEIKP